MSILSTFKKYKDYILTENGYQLSSRWTKSDAVIMGDGTDDSNTLEKNLGAIHGISNSLISDSNNIAFSCAGAKKLAQSVGVYLGEITIPSGSTSYVISNASITATSLIDIYYVEDSKDMAIYCDPKYTQSNGSIVITFSKNLESDIIIQNVKVVNP